MHAVHITSEFRAAAENKALLPIMIEESGLWEH